MRYDPATHALRGNYCAKCGRQSFDRRETTCKVCRAPLFQFRPPRSKRRRPMPQTIDDSMDAPTPKQTGILRRFGYTTTMSKREASKVIRAVAQNGWRPLPTEIGVKS